MHYGVAVILIQEALRAQDLDFSVALMIRNDMGRLEFDS